MNKPRLLLLSGDYSLDRGGIQNTSYLFASYFRDYFHVNAFTSKKGNEPDLPNVFSLKNKYSRLNPLGVLFFYKRAVELKKTQGLDYILAVHFSHALPCVFLKWFHKIPFGTLAHGEEVVKWPHKSFLTDIVWYIIYCPLRWLILRNASDIFANTHFTKGLVEKITSNKKITIINPPIGTMPSEDEVYINKSPLMLSVGRLEDRKGYQHVIKAVKEIGQRLPNLKYYIAGSGAYKSELEKLVKELEVGGQVKILGRIAEEEKCRLLKECGLFVMPSCKIKGKSSVEGFGLSLLEANSYGRFVISTVSGGIPEAVRDGETGFLIEENSVEQLVDAILKFYRPDFCYSVNACRAWAEQRYITIITNQYYEQIKKTIKVEI